MDLMKEINEKIKKFEVLRESLEPKDDKPKMNESFCKWARIPMLYWGSSIHKVMDENAKRVVMNLIMNFNKIDTIHLHIFGGSGVGKTSLGVVILNSLVQAGMNGLFITAPNLHKFIENDVEIRDELLYYVARKVDFLLIDEFGTEMVESYKSNNIISVIEDRIQEKKITCTTSHKMYTDLAVKYPPNSLSHSFRSLVEIELKKQYPNEDLKRRVELLNGPI